MSAVATEKIAPATALEAAAADLAAAPDGVLEAVAERHGLPLAAVLGLLPPEQASAIPGQAFEAIWTDLTGWGQVLFLIHDRNGVFEIKTALPPGSHGRGFFNIHGDTPLGGHLKADRCAAIWFVDRPFFGRRSCSVQFFDADGHSMFKVFVARDAARTLDAAQLDRFERLRAAYGSAGRPSPDAVAP